MKRTNVEKLEELGILGDIRLRLGADKEDETGYDNQINRMSARELTQEYSAWELGDESWANMILDTFEALNQPA